jgi:hypothetical protein
MTKSPHTGGERGIVPDWRAIGITRRLEVHDPVLILHTETRERRFILGKDRVIYTANLHVVTA